MNKKFIASVLAGACALSMTSIAAFAADSTGAVTTGSDGIASQEVTVSATTQMPTLNVTVPTTATVIVNPYKLSVTTPITSSDTIISPEYEIKNESDCGVTVSANAKVEAVGGVKIATKPLTGKETDKSAFMWIETTAESGTYYTTDIGTADTPNVVNTYVEKLVSAKKGETLTADQEAANTAFAAQTALTTKEAASTLATLAAGNSTAQSVYFKFLGDVATAPKTPWVAADGVKVTLTLKITPNANATTAAGGPSVSSYDGLTALSVTKTGAGEEIASFDAATKTYTVSGAAAFDAYTITPTAAAGSTATMACAGATGGAAGTFTPATGALSVGNTLPLAVVITVTDGTDTDTYTINFTA